MTENHPMHQGSVLENDDMSIHSDISGITSPPTTNQQPTLVKSSTNKSLKLQLQEASQPKFREINNIQSNIQNIQSKQVSQLKLDEEAQYPLKSARTVNFKPGMTYQEFLTDLKTVKERAAVKNASSYPSHEQLYAFRRRFEPGAVLHKINFTDEL